MNQIIKISFIFIYLFSSMLFAAEPPLRSVVLNNNNNAGQEGYNYAITFGLPNGITKKVAPGSQVALSPAEVQSLNGKREKISFSITHVREDGSTKTYTGYSLDGQPIEFKGAVNINAKMWTYKKPNDPFVWWKYEYTWTWKP